MRDMIFNKYGLNGQMGQLCVAVCSLCLVALDLDFDDHHARGAAPLREQRRGNENNWWQPLGGHPSCMEA